MVEGEEKKFVVNYDILYDVVRNEKNKEELQKLDPDFYVALANFITEQINAYKSEQQRLDLYSVAEAQDMAKRLANIQKLVKELYERREKKILQTALNKVRTGSHIIDTSAMLDVEKTIYSHLIDLLKGYRHEILDKLLSGKVPSRGMTEEEEKEIIDALAKQNQETPKEGFKKIKIIEDVPKFLGADLKEYGPYSRDEVIEIPEELALILLAKQRAVEIK